MDYQTLLKKYIEYIKDVEGTDYITIHDHRYMCEVKFTEEEWQELERLAELEAELARLKAGPTSNEQR